jgi:hypothetical protein
MIGLSQAPSQFFSIMGSFPIFQMFTDREWFSKGQFHP